MTILIYLLLALWLADGLWQIFVGILQTVVGITFLILGGTLILLSYVAELLHALWKAATC